MATAIPIPTDEAKGAWWIFLIRGLLTLGFGIVTMAWPKMTLTVLLVILAVFLIVEGFLEVIQALTDRRDGSSLWWIVPGGLAIIAGVVTFVWPHITALVLLYVFAFWAVIAGLVAIVGALRMRSARLPHWGWILAWGILVLAVGVWMIFEPHNGLLGLTWLLGIWAVVVGLLEVVLSFWVRGASKAAAA
jgi:uncharacterized membrane protein HdeD (DUF308 family)